MSARQLIFGELVLRLMDNLTEAEQGFPEGISPEHAAITFDIPDGGRWRLQVSREEVA